MSFNNEMINKLLREGNHYKSIDSVQESYNLPESSNRIYTPIFSKLSIKSGPPFYDLFLKKL